MYKALIFISAIIWVGCTGNSDQSSSQDNKAMKDDSLAIAKKYAPITDSSKLMVLKLNGEKMLYTNYKASYVAETPSMTSTFQQIDIDKDGNNEIYVDYFTGGAHCCQVNAILYRSDDNEMKEIYNFSGGTHLSGDTVIIDFYESLGYFNACYACNVEYPKNVGPNFYLIYNKGTFRTLDPNGQWSADFVNNLEFLKKKGIPELDDVYGPGMDNGTRKAFAYNLVGYYYNNNRDSTMTKMLFDQMYNSADKDSVWNELADYIHHFNEDIKQNISISH